MGLHLRTHPEPVDGCFGCRAMGVSILGYDSPRESGHVDRTAQKNWDKELDAYVDARKQGIQPASTRMSGIRAAVDASNKAGKAYDASTGSFSDTGV